MTLYDIIFYLFAIITVASAVIVVTSKNVIHAAFSLLLTFFGVSGIYVLLGADFLAVVQIMVYVGGILILLIFGVMLTNKITSVEIKTGTLNVLAASIIIGIFMGLVTSIMIWTDWFSMPAPLPTTTIYGLGETLVSEYVLIFELLGILLLIALVGAASIARREKE
jgi:NADH-quinone oxidoreductase subunit J